jgi:hypothetical protein
MCFKRTWIIVSKENIKKENMLSVLLLLLKIILQYIRKTIDFDVFVHFACLEQQLVTFNLV